MIELFIMGFWIFWTLISLVALVGAMFAPGEVSMLLKKYWDYLQRQDKKP